MPRLSAVGITDLQVGEDVKAPLNTAVAKPNEMTTATSSAATKSQIR